MDQRMPGGGGAPYLSSASACSSYPPSYLSHHGASALPQSFHSHHSLQSQSSLGGEEMRQDIYLDVAPELDQGQRQTSCHAALQPSGSVKPCGGDSRRLEEVRRNLNCALCNNLVASSLVLSCGHTFCGSCLFDYLNKKPSCPRCRVGLRSIPVRCLALDGVVEALLSGRGASDAELESLRARTEEGASAANKINKMFWWLQPAALPALGAADANPPSLPPSAHMQASQMAGRGRSVSNGGGSGQASRQPPHQTCLPQQPAIAPNLLGSSHSFTAGSQGGGGQQLRHNGNGSNAPRAPRASVPADYNYGSFALPFAQQSQMTPVSQMQSQMASLSQMAQMAPLGGGLTAPMHMQPSSGLGIGPLGMPPYNNGGLMEYSSAPCPATTMSNMQQQHQLQQLFQQLFQ